VPRPRFAILDGANQARSETVQSIPWGQLPLPERVERLRLDLDELIRVEGNNVGVRASQHRDLEMRMAQLEEAQRQILSRLSRLEAVQPDPRSEEL
jgi:hypothetical protein